MQENKKTKLPYNPEANEELFDQMFEVASSTECTGLFPTPPMTDEEINSYSNIYDVPLTKNIEAKNKEQQNNKQNK